jgi:hypothetical protein
MPQAIEHLNSRIEYSTQHGIEIERLLPKRLPNRIRLKYAHYAISLAQRHHSAITYLVKNNHYPSAQAMLRPLMEAGAIAYWLIYSAPTDLVERMSKAPLEGAQRNEDTPTLNEMVEQLKNSSAALQKIADLYRLLAKKTEGRWLNQYTHGGIAQLLTVS